MITTVLGVYFEETLEKHTTCQGVAAFNDYKKGVVPLRCLYVIGRLRLLKHQYLYQVEKSQRGDRWHLVKTASSIFVVWFVSHSQSHWGTKWANKVSNAFEARGSNHVCMKKTEILILKILQKDLSGAITNSLF